MAKHAARPCMDSRTYSNATASKRLKRHCTPAVGRHHASHKTRGTMLEAERLDRSQEGSANGRTRGPRPVESACPIQELCILIRMGYDLFAFTRTPIDDSVHFVHLRPWKREVDRWVCRAKNWHIVINSSESIANLDMGQVISEIRRVRPET